MLSQAVGSVLGRTSTNDQATNVGDAITAVSEKVSSSIGYLRSVGEERKFHK